MVNLGETVYFVGYARLPEIVPARKHNDKVSVGLEVDMETYTIVNVSSTIPTALGRDIIESCIKGKNIATDQKKIIETIRRRFQGEAQKAIIVAFLNAAERFEKNRTDNSDRK